MVAPLDDFDVHEYLEQVHADIAATEGTAIGDREPDSNVLHGFPMSLTAEFEAAGAADTADGANKRKCN